MRRLSFSNAVSLLALFIALGGTSYAVIKLPAKSVGTRELKSSAVNSSKVRNGSIAGIDLAPSAAGRRGPRGPEGPAGPAGASGGAGAAAPWQVLPFAGTWTNYASGYLTAAFRKDQNGEVRLRGLVTKNAGLPIGGDVIAVLPPGYRPPATAIFAVASGGTTDQYGRIDVGVDGAIVWRSGGTSETDFTSLDTIRFSPDA